MLLKELTRWPECYLNWFLMIYTTWKYTIYFQYRRFAHFLSGDWGGKQKSQRERGTVGQEVMGQWAQKRPGQWVLCTWVKKGVWAWGRMPGWKALGWAQTKSTGRKTVDRARQISCQLSTKVINPCNAFLKVSSPDNLSRENGASHTALCPFQLSLKKFSIQVLTERLQWGPTKPLLLELVTEWQKAA